MTVQEFKKYVYSWAERINVANKISSIHIRSMKNKIASCSAKGRITFDSSILKLPPEELNQIIAHELLHLRYKNHSKMFKLLLKNYLKNNDNISFFSEE